MQTSLLIQLFKVTLNFLFMPIPFQCACDRTAEFQKCAWQESEWAKDGAEWAGETIAGWGKCCVQTF